MRSRLTPGAHEIAGESFETALVVAVHADAVVNREARVVPREHGIDAVVVDEVVLLEQAKDLMAEEELGSMVVELWERDEAAASGPAAAGDDRVDMRVVACPSTSELAVRCKRHPPIRDSETAESVSVPATAIIGAWERRQGPIPVGSPSFRGSCDG